jgi:glycosyltransferase involved in cell wall biosynthesis
MRIAFLCDEYPPAGHGGIGTATRLLARALVRAGHAVRVVGTYVDRTGPRDDDGVEIVRLPVAPSRLGWMADRRATYRMVARWASAGEIDLVEAPDFAGGCAGWPRLPVPVVVRLHASLTYLAAEAGRPVGRTTRWLEQAGVRRADAIVSPSAYTVDATRRCLALPSLPAAVVPNFVDVPDVAGGPRQDTVVFTGSLAPRKGVHALCRAWPLVLARHPAARLHLYGKEGRGTHGGTMRAELERLLPEAARTTVRFHGHVPRDVVLDALARARVGVFPSFVESFALAPLEAMAAGCPTIYTTRGPGPELVAHGVSGLLVDPADPADVAAQIVHLLRDDRLADRLGRAGRARIAGCFSEAAVLPQNVAFYERVVATFRARAAVPVRAWA